MITASVDPAPAAAPPAVAVSEPGSRPLRRPAHERYARARSILCPKIEAYATAFGHILSELSPEQYHCVRGNASKLERSRKILDRIAWLQRQGEALLAEKRARIERELSLMAFANFAELYETVDEDGERVQRLKDFAALPEELQRAITGVDKSGAPKIDKLGALAELKKLLGLERLTAELSGPGGAPLQVVFNTTYETGPQS